MTRCVCTHSRNLHKDGICQAVANPCGCTSFETLKEADKPSQPPKFGCYYCEKNIDHWWSEL